MSTKPCVRCGVPGTRNGICPTCQVFTSRGPGSTTKRGYGSTHQRRAAALRGRGLPCSLCGQEIDYQLTAPHPHSFTAHHTTRDKSGPIAPAHRFCNEREGKPTG